MDVADEEKDIVIIGGGICGLATALALHRKGISSVVLERSESLRVSGTTLTVQANGWRALEYLGLGSRLRETSVRLQMFREIQLDKDMQKLFPLSTNETRCIKRKDLTESLTKDLPANTIRFGCQVISVKLSHLDSYPILQLQDGSHIKAKVLIGCDGVNSVVADFLKLKPLKLSSTYVVRAFTNYINGHGFAYEVVQTCRGQILTGRMPINDKVVYWYIIRQWTPQVMEVSKDSELIKNLSLESIHGFPSEITEMIKNSDLNSISITRFKYRTPWDLILGTFRKGTVTVAGDAMHAMAPFIAQGGSTCLEDAIVLARSLAQKMPQVISKGEGGHVMVKKIGEAMDQYVTERRMRLVRLSTHSYLTGKVEDTSALLVKLVIIVFMSILFSGPNCHGQYDCGCL